MYSNEKFEKVIVNPCLQRIIKVKKDTILFVRYLSFNRLRSNHD